MDQLLAKLTDLGYEFFGVLLPGFIAVCFVLLSYHAMSPVIPSELAAEIKAVVAVVARWPDLLALAVLVLVCFFFGHALTAIGRKGARERSDSDGLWSKSCRGSGGALARLVRACVRRKDVARFVRRRRVLQGRLGQLGLSSWRFLSVTRTRPPASYSKCFDWHYDRAREWIYPARKNANDDWTHFYPVARAVVLNRSTLSLMNSYQNKYTLYRAICTASASWFWATVVLVAVACVGRWHCGVSPRWIVLAFNLAASLCLLFAFSGSYRYHWKLWGNTVLAETYAQDVLRKLPSKGEK